MPEIYEYFDYRVLLKDLYDQRKEANPHFSYRVLAKKADFSSAGFFSKILKGSTNISQKTMLNLGHVFGFHKQEMKYFELLVNYNQAKTHEEKKHYFEQLLSMRKSKIKTLEADQYELFKHWYYITILELLSFYVFKGDFEELAKVLHPVITSSQAEQAIGVLERLSLIEKNPDGVYEKVNAVISTGEEWKSLAVAGFQKNMIQNGLKALTITPKLDRDISTLTLSISAESFDRITEKLKDFRREVLEIARNEERPDSVYQLNLQMFPLSKKGRLRK